MTDSADLGVAISDSFRFASNVATECEALIKLAMEEVSRMLLEPDIRQLYSAAGDWLSSYQEDDSGWLNTEIAGSLGLKKGRKRNPSGNVFIQASLIGCGMNAVGNDEPLLHVGWWHDPIVFGETQMGFPMDSGEDYQLSLQDGRLFLWRHKVAEDEWCYSLRLTDVNNLENLKRLVVAPLKQLLLGLPAGEVLANLSAVHYTPVDGDLGQFKVSPGR
jgi:hypothetical protein